MQRIIVVLIVAFFVGACPRRDEVTFSDGQKSALPHGVRARYGFPVDFFFYPASESAAGPVLRLAVEESNTVLAFISVNEKGRVIERGRSRIGTADPSMGSAQILFPFLWEAWVISHCAKGGGDSWKINRRLVGRLFAADDGSCNGMVVEPAR